MFQDGFGVRALTFDPESGDPVEVLSFAPLLATEPEFAAAVDERVARLARVRHALYARVRRVERPSEYALLLFADHVPGWRLSDVLAVAERERWGVDITVVVALLRQLVPAVSLFSRHQREATIGTVAPERLILTPQGRLVLAEYVMAPGLERLQLPRARLWREFRVAIPHHASPARIPPTADVVGLGIVALSLLLGRTLKEDEYLVSLGDLVASATEPTNGNATAISGALGTWLARALQFEGEASFHSTQEAQAAFEELLANDRSFVASPAALNEFIARYERIGGRPGAPDRDAISALVVPPSPVHAAERAADVFTMPPSAVTAAFDTPAFDAPAGIDVSVVLDAAVAAAAPAPSEAPAEAPAVDVPPAPAVTAAPPTPAASVAAATPAALPTAAPAAASPATTAPAAPATAFPLLARFPDKPTRVAVAVLVLLAVVEAAVILWLLTSDAPAALARGELVVQSRPAAARVSIDGEERGLTPYTAELSPGSHVVEVRVGRAEPRVIPVVIRAGTQANLYVELQSVATVGGLDVRTDPPKAQVTVGGQDRGVTPLVLRDLPPGDLEVVVRLGGREVRQTVRIEPGNISQLVVPLGR